MTANAVVDSYSIDCLVELIAIRIAMMCCRIENSSLLDASAIFHSEFPFVWQSYMSGTALDGKRSTSSDGPMKKLNVVVDLFRVLIVPTDASQTSCVEELRLCSDDVLASRNIFYPDESIRRVVGWRSDIILSLPSLSASDNS